MSSSATAAQPLAGRARLPFDGYRGGRSVVVGWLVTRAVMFALMATTEAFVNGDVFYYQRKIAAMWSVGLPATLNEYPTPVAWLLTVPYAFTLGSKAAYLVAYVAVMAILDAVFTLVLFRAAGRRRDVGVDFWLAFIVLVGPLTYLRFDLVPAVLAGGALLAARRRPWLAGALTGLGAAIKLWPALLYGVLLARRSRRGQLSWGFWGVGLGLAVLSVVFGGFSRLVSPLTWQADRGLQIESLWSTPVMVLRAVRPRTWTVDMSRYQAYEVFGPDVAGYLTASNVATVAGLVLMGVLFVRAFAAGAVSARAVGLLVVAVIAVTIVTNKTLSPQYLLWLGGPVAVLLLLDRSPDKGGGDPAPPGTVPAPVVRADGRDRDSAAIDGLARQALILAVLTHLVYPVLYDGLIGQRGHAGVVVATAVTALRNVMLLVFTVAACRSAWVALGPGRPRPEPPLPTL